MSRPDQLGVRTLKLLAEQSMVATLRCLAEGTLRPAELERGLGDGGHTTAMRRLRHLLDRKLVSYEHRPGLPPRGRRAAVPRRAHYSLTEGGRMLLEVPAAGAHWEQRWRARLPQGASAGAPQDVSAGVFVLDGTFAIKLLADDHTREIVLLLAGGPLFARDLDERAPNLGRSALRRRLRDLGLAGLLERSERAGIPRYGLTVAARGLAPVAMSAGCWELRWAHPRGPARGDRFGEPRWWDALRARP
jgi:DNA-binding HxlR family transcriptional regulator